MSLTVSTSTTTTTANADVLRLGLMSPSASTPTASSSRLSRINEDAVKSLALPDRALFAQYGLGPRRRVEIPLVHNGFERHVRTQPEAVAVEHSLYHHSLTYAQLDRHANRLAHRLRTHGVVPGHRVVILSRRSIYYVVAVLAVLKAGGQYVPLDAVTVTDDTLAHVLSDSKATLCLVMEEYGARVKGMSKLVLESTIQEDEMKDAPAHKPEELARPEDGCYVIYTSGTTGKPKGVDVRHRGVSNVICGSPGNVGMRPGMRVAQLLNIAFDMGAWETLGSLYNGSTLCLRGNTSKEWAALLKTVDVVISTPSILARHDPAQYPSIKHVIVGGEPCPQALADRWARFCAFNNCCGPTEISIMNTVQRHTPGYPLSIGTPIPNTNVYVLGRDPLDTTPAPIGAVGCMWVGGLGVSGGYLGLPEKTAERWRPDPFVGHGAMMFNTGDLGAWRTDGQLDHHGRADDQVKVKGFRVELDGVSAAMRAHEPVDDALALLIGTELWGFVAPANVDLAAVRAATARSQPYYAVPSQFLALAEFPMTKNGKVDKRALRELAEAAPKPTPAVPTPTPASPDLLTVPRSTPARLTVANGGVPYRASLPGTPYIPPAGAFDTPQWSPNAAAFTINDAPLTAEPDPLAPVLTAFSPVFAEKATDAALAPAPAPTFAKPWFSWVSSTMGRIAGAVAVVAIGTLVARRTLLASS